MKNRNRSNDYKQKFAYNFNKKNDNEPINEETYQSQLKKIYEERLKIQNRIKKLDEEAKHNKNNEEMNLFSQKAHINYTRNNFKYMNNLLEEHFKKNIINNDDELKKFVKKDFDNFQNQLIEDFTLFKNRQKVFLERLQDKFFLINRKKNNMETLDEKAELKSEPLYSGENIKNIFIELPQNKYNLIINTPGDTKNELINNNESNYYKNKLCHNIIQCMGNTKDENTENFTPPIDQFIEVKNAKISIDYYHQALNEFKEKRENEKEMKQSEEKKIKDETKTINFQNKLFETKFNFYQDEIKDLNDINEQNLNIIGDIKNKMTKDQLFGDLTQKKLNIFKKDEKEIKDILNDKNSKFDFFNVHNINDNEEEKEEYLKKLNDMKDKYEEDFKNLNDKIDKLKKKYKNKSKNKNKQRNKSSNIMKRTYYNDNPNHYNYNYDRASINIKKKLHRYL